MISNRYFNDGNPSIKLNPLQQRMKRQIDAKVAQGNYSFENVACAICGSQNNENISEKDRYGLYCPNVICRDCGLVMLNPRMTASSYNEFYNEEYRSLYTGLEFNAANFFSGQLKRGERLYRYLTSQDLLSAESDHPLFVLEVGCGAGGILSYFRDQGHRVKGIDLGEEYLNYGKEQHGLDLESGTIFDLVLSETPDLIIYSHVLEHILDLNKEVNQIRKISNNNTLVYVEVPGIKNLAYGYRYDPLLYFQNAHTYSFSLRSLENLFAKHDYEMIRGDEFVKAVFKAGPAKQQLENEYDDIFQYLKGAEISRKSYPFSFTRLKVIFDALKSKLLKT